MKQQNTDVKYFPLLREFKAIQDKGYKLIFSANQFDSGVVYSTKKHLVIVSTDTTMSELHYALVRLGERL